MRVAISHDYLTQRGGAERVVLALARAFPSAPIYTSLYDPAGTFPDFAGLDVRVSGINSLGVLRRNHRLALPLLRRTFDTMRIDADLVVCSSSGWAHGVRTSGTTVVYCHSPARWLHARDQYLPRRGAGLARVALGVLGRGLLTWDRGAAARANVYVVNSTLIRDRVAHAYGRSAAIVAPPVAVDAAGAQIAVPGVAPGFVLCVARLLPYKHVEEVTRAFAALPAERLVVVGRGPEAVNIRRVAGPNVAILGAVTDGQLRWLYAQCAGLVAASHEDFGLTPVEAAAFGKPVAALRYGGFLDTVDPGVTGVFFDDPTPGAIAHGVRRMLDAEWDAQRLVAHADQFSEARFIERIRAVAVGAVAPMGSAPVIARPNASPQD